MATRTVVFCARTTDIPIVYGEAIQRRKGAHLPVGWVGFRWDITHGSLPWTHRRVEDSTFSGGILNCPSFVC